MEQILQLHKTDDKGLKAGRLKTLFPSGVSFVSLSLHDLKDTDQSLAIQTQASSINPFSKQEHYLKRTI